MSILTPDKVRIEHGLTINEKIIPDSARASKYVASWVQKGQPMKPCVKLNTPTGNPVAITIHNTDRITTASNTTPAEQYTRATWPNCNMGGVVVHYYVDDVCAWQNLNDNEQGWHAGDGSGTGNTKTIAIEIVMNGSGDSKDVAAENNGALLAAILMNKYNLSIDDLHSHYYYSPIKKNCPIYIRPHWDQFANKVQTYMNQIKGNSSSNSGSNSGSSSTGTLYYVQVGAFSQLNLAKNYAKQINNAGYQTVIKKINNLYKIQVGAYSNRSNANNMMNELKGKGFSSFVTTENGEIVA